MKKLSFLFSILLLAVISVSAQRLNTYFIKNNGEYVTKTDSADFYRVVQEPAKGSALYLTKEFYKNGVRKSVGYSSEIDPPKYEGKYSTYFENGKIRQVANYVKGKISDTVVNYYPNGNLYSVIIYQPSQTGPPTSIRSVKDSAGRDLVANGNGDAVFYDKNFTYIIEKGVIKNGVRDGVWTGEVRENGLTFKDVYANGKLVSGESTDEAGQTYTYTNPHVLPSFKGGMDKFYKFIAQTVKYPRSAVYQRIQGIVMVRFSVLTDGSVSDVHAINYADKDLAKEAVFVIKSSPAWAPGVFRGKTVKTFHDVPVSFSLSRER